MAVLIEMWMTEGDFGRIIENSMRWKGTPWNSGRFDRVNNPQDKIGEHWEFIHWVGISWSDVMLVKAYLKAHNEKYEVVIDHGSDDLKYAVLTNYRPKSRQEGLDGQKDHGPHS